MVEVKLCCLQSNSQHAIQGGSMGLSLNSSCNTALVHDRSHEGAFGKRNRMLREVMRCLCGNDLDVVQHDGDSQVYVLTTNKRVN